MIADTWPPRVDPYVPNPGAVDACAGGTISIGPFPPAVCHPGAAMWLTNWVAGMALVGCLLAFVVCVGGWRLFPHRGFAVGIVTAPVAACLIAAAGIIVNHWLAVFGTFH